MQFIAQKQTPLLPLLKQLFPESSMNTLRSWLEKERVMLDGIVVKKAQHLVQQGQALSIGQKAPFLDQGVKILYEDSHLTVIYKPEGLLSVATDFDQTISAHEILKRRFHNQKVYPVQRLDRETSGVMVFAYSENARDGLKALFEEHTIEREYLAIVEGVLTQKRGTWTSRLVEDSSYYVRSTRSRTGKLSTTHYEVVSETTTHTFLRFHLETGRKNQIRVHCKEAGHPIAGDQKYGAKTHLSKRLFLHAHKLGFVHPMTQELLTFTVPLPEAFHPLLR